MSHWVKAAIQLVSNALSGMSLDTNEKLDSPTKCALIRDSLETNWNLSQLTRFMFILTSIKDTLKQKRFSRF